MTILSAAIVSAAARKEETKTSANRADPRRAVEPGEASHRSSAYHGPGHEIVKKTFRDARRRRLCVTIGQSRE
jgi:hypothetical protein